MGVSGRLWQALGGFGMLRNALGRFEGKASKSFEALDALDASEGFGRL